MKNCESILLPSPGFAGEGPGVRVLLLKLPTTGDHPIPASDRADCVRASLSKTLTPNPSPAKPGEGGRIFGC